MVCLALTSTLTSKSSLQNSQVHPPGIEYSTQFVTPALPLDQPKVFNQVMSLSADFGKRCVQPKTISASKSD
jgi:hypothetical protein